MATHYSGEIALGTRSSWFPRRSTTVAAFVDDISELEGFRRAQGEIRRYASDVEREQLRELAQVVGDFEFETP
jgi:hypothetical protein